MELSSPQLSHIMRRFPEFELSYETISHKKVSPAYNICLAVPTGKKVFVWFTFHQDTDVFYVLDLNKEKKIVKASRYLNTAENNILSHGTIFYGTLVSNEITNSQLFVIEDIFFYKGIPLKTLKYGEKAVLLCNIRKTNSIGGNQKFQFALPIVWKFDEVGNKDSEYPSTIPEKITNKISYPIHHLQYRSVFETMPYLNVFLNRKINLPAKPIEQKKQSEHKFDTIRFNMDTNKPQYKYPTVFQVTADIQFDIYHLFVYGKDNKSVYFNVAYIPNCKTSVFMNSLFRNIRENKNIDYIEESDDEDDFQNLNEDKYVDLNKVLLVECIFNHKFKKWTPIRLVDKHSKVVHMNKLAR